MFFTLCCDENLSKRAKPTPTPSLVKQAQVDKPRLLYHPFAHKQFDGLFEKLHLRLKIKFVLEQRVMHARADKKNMRGVIISLEMLRRGSNALA